MGRNRLEAFSDGVLAIIITIMVLDLKVPHGTDLGALYPLWPVFLCYVLSFVYLAIYWNNHHHMLHTTQHVTGAILWANLHLLFWLSLFPFATAWMGENHFSTWPVALYGCISLMAGIAYYLLAQCLIRVHGKDSTLGKVIGRDRKGIRSIVIYILGVGFCFINPWIGFAMYVLVACIWFIPDRRIEKNL